MRFKPTLLFCLVFALAAIHQPLFGQNTGNHSGGDDPFREDPLFSRSLGELLGTSSDSSTGDDTRYWDRLYRHGIDLGGTLEAGPYSSSALYGTYPTLPMIHFNRVDGLFLGVRKERMQWYDSDWLLDIPRIKPHGMLGYAFSLGEWQYSIGAERLFGKRRHVMVGAEYHSATTTDDYWRVGLNETSLTAFAGGYDYLDYYRQRGWGAYLLVRTNRLFEGGIALNDNRFSSLDRQLDWALFGSGGRYRENPPVDRNGEMAIDTLRLSTLTFSATFNPKRVVLTPRFTFSANAEVEVADPGVSSSDYDYTRFLAELVTFYNFERGGVLKHRLRMGGITGEAPLMKKFQLGGVGSLRAIPYKSLFGGLPGNQMMLSNVEMQFGSPDIGEDLWIDLDEMYFSLFLDSGWTGGSDETSGGGSPFSGFSEFSMPDLYHNAGFGLGSSSLRFELAWDLEKTGRAPVLWIRFNPSF